LTVSECAYNNKYDLLEGVQKLGRNKLW